MKEITVTFENGAIFNGSANSMALNGETTYYFQADKYYRVQVNALSAITLQEYQNTNGAWYPIDIITKVAVAEIETKDVVTKEYLEENYYNKQQTDDKYVFKAGDTMTGKLTIKFAGNGDYIEITNHTINLRTPDDNYYMQLYINNLNIYNGTIRMRDTDELNSAELLRVTKSGVNIYDNDGGWIGGFQQENDRAFTALHIFNNGRIVMHTGAASTTETYMQIQGPNFQMFNPSDTSAIRFYSATIMEATLTTNQRLNGYGNNYFNGLNIMDGFSIRVGQDSSYTYLGSQLISIHKDSSNQISINPDSVLIYSSNQKSCEFSNSRGVELYGGKALILHNDYNINGKHTAYNWNSINIYNFASSDTWTFWLNAATVNWYCQRFLAYATSTARIQSSNSDAELAGNAGTITANNAPKALNNEFFSNNFLNALNLFLEYMQDNIKSAAPNYSRVNEISFSSETFGGGFQAGGGSSRGGGVGRRSVG